MHVSSCKISAKSDNRRPSYSDWTKSRWPPSAILDIWGGRAWTTPHIVGPHFFTHTPNLVKISWAAPEICTQNRVRKNAPWRRNSISGSNYDASRHSGTFVCVIAKHFSQIGQSEAELWRFNLFTLSGPLWGLLCANGSQSWGNPPLPVDIMKYAHHRSLSFFLDFRKSLPVRIGGAPNRSGIEIWVKIFDIFPPVKIGNVGGISVDFYGGVPGPPTTVWKPCAFLRQFSIYKFRWQKINL